MSIEAGVVNEEEVVSVVFLENFVSPTLGYALGTLPAYHQGSVLAYTGEELEDHTQEVSNHHFGLKLIHELFSLPLGSNLPVLNLMISGNRFSLRVKAADLPFSS